MTSIIVAVQAEPSWPLQTKVCWWSYLSGALAAGRMSPINISEIRPRQTEIRLYNSSSSLKPYSARFLARADISLRYALWRNRNATGNAINFLGGETQRSSTAMRRRSRWGVAVAMRNKQPIKFRISSNSQCSPSFWSWDCISVTVETQILVP